MNKALIFDIKHFAIHDGDGIRTTVFFKGCPLRCVWCHNPEGLFQKTELAFFSHKCTGCGVCSDICRSAAARNMAITGCTACGKCVSSCPSDARRIYGKAVTVSDILPELTEDIAFYQSTGGGVTLSGGECLLYPDFCAELLKELKDMGVQTAVDTCGYVPEQSINKVLPYTDVFLYDIKAIDSEVHKRCTGVSNEKILKNFIHIADSKKKIEIRIPFVPDYNSDEIPEIAEFISRYAPGAFVRLLPFHNYAESKYSALGLESKMPKRLPTEEECQKAKSILLAHGLKIKE